MESSSSEFETSKYGGLYSAGDARLVFLKLSFFSADFSQAGRYSVEVGARPSADPTMEAEGTDMGQGRLDGERIGV